ncbi:OLC1v1030357C1 [Oldenlandia corymbosa var. corymbosa]|uniref:chorismate mutase n=1 Tax=Oldenlandia corymbosa var. corymbosa TaxID=529605 RepID=A0AAV1CFV4_OLDCO|nr:OLC1v1030357C1 [Oldenlandia corymbosa var. corymbosa]
MHPISREREILYTVLNFVPAIYILHRKVLNFEGAIVVMADSSGFTLESVRKSLIRQEDTLVFNLIERAKYPIVPQLYDDGNCPILPGSSDSFLESFVKETEAVQAKFGRYQSPEEHPFFPDKLPESLVLPPRTTQILHSAAASININKAIWDIYINKVLPLIASEGRDDNYTSIAGCDLQCLQALSRRIHYGKFVAEVKFKDAPEEYTPAIQAQVTFSHYYTDVANQLLMPTIIIMIS